MPKTNPLPPLARRLRKLRETAGLSLAELSRRAGVASPVIWRIEAGERGCTWETACRLADALGVSLERLR